MQRAASPEQRGTGDELVLLIRSDGCEYPQDGPAVVEETENKDGMKPLAEDKWENYPIRHAAGLSVDLEGQENGQEVQDAVDLLSQLDPGKWRLG